MTRYVQIIERKMPKAVIKQIECSSEKSACQVLRGVEVNLDHAEYFVRVAVAPSSECEVTR